MRPGPLAALLLLPVMLLPLGIAPAPAQPAPPDQNWTRSEQEIFWNSPVGSRLLPYTWFSRLEQPGGALFADPAHLLTYGFIATPATAANPDGLPIGLSRERDRTDGLWLGMTCAACHVRTLAFRGATLLLDGAGASLDAVRFDRDLTDALLATAADPDRAARFAAGLGVAEADRPALLARLGRIAEARRAAAVPEAVAAGPGRFDLVGTLANALAGTALGLPANIHPTAAPVRMPRLWGAPGLDSTLANGSGTNAGSGPLLRNLGQVLATGATLDPAPPSPPYPGSASLFDLVKIEALLRKLDPPPWPAAFPPIDAAAAGRGQAVFAQACAACHAPQPRDAAGLLPVTRVGVAQLGTDAAALRPLPPAATGVLAGRPVAAAGGPRFGLVAPAAAIVGHLVAGAAAQYPRLPPPPPAPPARDAYRALPLAGIWANAPFLHDGAVANLWQLLTPPDQRAARFSLAPGDYDPAEVGLSTAATAPPLFEATGPGNAATGHDYGTALPEPVRRDLLEYLKTL